MAKKRVIDALCPRCRGSRKSDVHGFVESSWEHDEGAMLKKHGIVIK